MASMANRGLTPKASFKPGASPLGACAPTSQLLWPSHGGKGGRGPSGGGAAR